MKIAKNTTKQKLCATLRCVICYTQRRSNGVVSENRGALLQEFKCFKGKKR